LHALYLLFNEGYSASAGAQLVRADLTRESIRLGRLLVELLPEAEAMGLLALMLLHDARRDTRTTPDGALVLLEDQDRTRWDQAQITDGRALVQRALTTRRFGSYAVQAAIAAVHADAASASDTDWREIVGLYDILIRIDDTPVTHLNRAVALAMRDGPAAALNIVRALATDGLLTRYAPAHVAHGELARRLGDLDTARAAFTSALALVTHPAQARLLEQRLAALGNDSPLTTDATG
jgi:RNA polymerase sigma-70 factor, ECF subfamily